MANEGESHIDRLAQKLASLEQHVQTELGAATTRTTDLARDFAALSQRIIPSVREVQQNNRRLQVTKWLWTVGVALIGWLAVRPPWDVLYKDWYDLYKGWGGLTDWMVSFKSLRTNPGYHLPYVTSLLILLFLSLSFGVVYVLKRTGWSWRSQIFTMVTSLVLVSGYLILIPEWQSKVFGLSFVPRRVSLVVEPGTTVGLDTGGATIGITPGQKISIDQQSLNDLTAIKDCLINFKGCADLGTKINTIARSIESLRPERSAQRER